MPPKELAFRSEATRSAAIGVVMAIVLGGSIVLAYTLAAARQEPWTINRDDSVETRPVNMGPLMLSIPERFQQVPGQPPIVGLDLLTEFSDQLDPNRRLQVAAMGKPKPQNTLIALNRALNIMITDELQQDLQQWNRVSQFRVDQTVGAWYTGIRRSGDATQLHLIGVLTGEGQRYWMVYLSHEIDRPELLIEAMESARRLFGAVMGSATWRNQPNRGLPTSL